MDQFLKIHASLPIFSIPGSGKTILYTPGKSKAYPTGLVDGLFDISDQANFESCSVFIQDEIKQLVDAAVTAEKKWNDLFDRTFKPECLTVYPGNACNLDCTYCYVKEKNNKTIDREFVKAAAEYTAGCCALEQRPLFLVFHGGGEPTFHWTLLTDLHELVNQICLKHNVPVFSYIATNGIFSGKQAVWLAKNFSRIGVSCDGFPWIHDSQRNSSQFKETSAILKRNVHSLLELNENIDVRVTITPQSMGFMEEIVMYLINELHLMNIHIEPVYSYGNPGFNPTDAKPYADHFMGSSLAAEKSGASVSYSGVRMKEFHSGYCDILRNTLRITPDNEIVNCFLDSSSTVVNPVYNHLGGKANGFIELNYKEIQKTKGLLRDLPEPCSGCINMYHCSRTCPEYCMLSEMNSAEINLPGSFRCLLNKELAVRYIKKETGVC